MNSICADISIPETEDSWEKILKSISKLTTLTKEYGNTGYPDDLVFTVKDLYRPLTSAMVSERTRLSGSAIELVCVLASVLGSSFEPLLPLFVPTVLTLCSRTNKVFTKRAQACLLAIIEGTLLPTILPFLLEAVKDKSATLRLAATEGLLICLNCFNPPDLEKESRAVIIEGVIKATARDANVDVRKASRKVFDAYKILLPSRVNAFVAPLTPTTKKYLDIKATPSFVVQHQTAQSKPHLSSSTSALQSTISTLSGSNSQHTRSASSSALSTSRDSQKAEVNVNRKRDMAPPDFIPVRPAPSSRPVSVISQTSTDGPPRRPTSAASTRSVDGPVRPKSATEVAFPPQLPIRAAQPPSRHVNSTSSSVPSTSGPMRSESTSAPIRKDGPLRPPPGFRVAMVPSPKEEAPVKGGARRIPMPDMIVPVKNEDGPAPVQQRARTLSRSARSTPAVPNVKSDLSTKTTVTSSRPTATASTKPAVTKANEKPKPVPRARTKSTTAAPSTTSSSVTNTVTTTSAAGQFRPIASTRSTGGTLMQPTLSQLSRTKPLVVKKSEPFARPTWGRPVVQRKPSVPAIKSKAAQDLGKGKLSKSTGPSTVPSKDGRTTPALVPLPPSPVAESPEDEEVPDDGPAAEIVSKETDATDKASADSPTELAKTPGTPPSIVQVQITSSPTPTRPSSSLPASDRTPISALVSSIQQGFLFTPSTPLSPPQSYLPLLPKKHEVPLPAVFSVDMITRRAFGNDFTDAVKTASVTDDSTRAVLGDVEGNR